MNIKAMSLVYGRGDMSRVRDKTSMTHRRMNGMPKQEKLDLDDPEVGLRKCLGCFDAFLSSWKGNRLCPECTIKNKSQSMPYDYLIMSETLENKIGDMLDTQEIQTDE